MKPLRVTLLVLGSIIAVIGFGLLAAGASLGWSYGTQRDDAGFFTTSNERFETDSFALTSDKIDLGQPGPDDWWADRDLATVRITVDNADADAGPVFVGIGPESEVEAYLADIPHDAISDVHFHQFSVDYRRENAGGTGTPAPPADQAFWVARASGQASQSLTWDLEPGKWAIVVMNADATASVVADIELGGQVDYLVPIAIGLVIGGIVLLAIAAAMIIVGVVRAQVASDTAIPLPTGVAQPVAQQASFVAYPLRLEGHLDPDLGRWKWLVKWFLAIPHFVVLAFLWVAFVVLTFVAFFAILFTGRYPRSIFEFNVGVLRWSWRVAYYATSVLGTDRYPPFTLNAVEYPASLDVAYPEHLSRRLVLAKSWLLAIPHLLIVWALTASWGTGGSDDGARFVFSGGLLGLVVTIAAIILLFTGRYPVGLYNLIMGAMRWTYRVIAYVALMTDDYPPFQLDQGGSEPPADRRPAPFPPPQMPPNSPSQ